MVDRMGIVSLTEKKGFQKVTFNKYYILIGVLGFFISRASIVNDFTPFGVSFLAASFSTSFPIVSLLSVIAGILSFHGLKGYNYLISIGIMYLIFLINGDKKKLSILKVSIFSALIITVVNILNLIISSEYYIYDFIMVAFEGLVVFTLSYIFSHSIPIGEIKRDKLTDEEVICVFITLSLALAGLNDIKILGVSIKNVLSILFVLISGYNYGPPLGAGMGITVGMISYLSQLDMPFLLSIYGLAGLFSGVFRDLGKVGSILGFVLGNCIISFYINGFSTSFLTYYELAIAFGVFIAFSKFIKENILGASFSAITTDKSSSYGEKIRDLTTKRLGEVSDVFNELSKIFTKVSNNEIEYTDNATKIIDQVANDVCKNCSMNVFCWKEDFYTTYYSMFNLINDIELKGAIDEGHLPELFSDTCVKADKVFEKMYRLFDVYKLNCIWERKMSENRELISEHLNGISQIMEDIMLDIDKRIVFKEDVEILLYSSLKSKGVNVSNVVVTEFDEDDFEIYVEVNKCFRKVNSLENVINIVSEAIDIPLKGDFTTNTIKTKETNRYKLVKANRYGAMTKVSGNSESFNCVSGDSYTFGEENNIYFAAISDGMGIGRRANFESSTAISLLEKFLEAGFKKEIALKTINSILMLKSEEEIFTTLDISTLDLYSGKLQVIKNGASPTFIKKKDCVKVINSYSLPVGILKDVDLEIYEEYLEDGDLVIMMSDGVLEANEEEINKEKWMIEIIESIDNFNPQTIANMIMKEAKKASKEKTRDDMTVLVTKVWKTR